MFSVFAVGVLLAAALVFKGDICPGLPGRLFREMLGRSPALEQMQFKEVMAGNGIGKGYHFDVHAYLSSDCIRLSVETQKWGSPAEAGEEMQRRIDGAHKVLEKGLMFDHDHHPLGERAVLLVGTSSHRAAILWRNESQLRIIESTSLARALEFETRNSP